MAALREGLYFMSLPTPSPKFLDPLLTIVSYLTNQILRTSNLRYAKATPNEHFLILKDDSLEHYLQSSNRYGNRFGNSCLGGKASIMLQSHQMIFKINLLPTVRSDWLHTVRSNGLHPMCCSPIEQFGANYLV